MSGSFFVPRDLDAPLRGAATGPLAGFTAVVKDMYDIAGSRTGGGNPDWLAAQAPASRHAVAVEQILAAGATITGKTICDEFFYSVAGVNAHYGTPANLRAPGRLPGGSSSGSAAACGANACDFALGSDTGGSVRIPASFNGLYGLRPTHGRVDLTGAMAMAPTFDVVGWFANSPGIFRRVGTVLLRGEAVAAQPARLMVATDAFAQADAEVAALCREFLMRAGKLLPRPTELAGTAPNGFDAWREAFRIVQAKEVLGNLRRLRHASKAQARSRRQGAHGICRNGNGGSGGWRTKGRGCGARSSACVAAARHGAGAADLSLDCAAGRFERRGDGILPRAGNAAHLYGGTGRTATDESACRHRCRLPGGALADRLGRRRRGAARPRRPARPLLRHRTGVALQPDTHILPARKAGDRWASNEMRAISTT